MASYRLSERFEGVQWLGSETPEADVEWLKGLPDGPSHAIAVAIDGDTLLVDTKMTRNEASAGDYVVYGDNLQPLVIPSNLFERRYEEVPE